MTPQMQIILVLGYRVNRWQSMNVQVQYTEYCDKCCDETETAEDTVLVNRCIVLEPRTKCIDPNVD